MLALDWRFFLPWVEVKRGALPATLQSPERSSWALLAQSWKRVPRSSGPGVQKANIRVKQVEKGSKCPLFHSFFWLKIFKSLFWIGSKKKPINRKHVNIFLTALAGQSSQGQTPTCPRTNGTKWRFYCAIKQRKAGLSQGRVPFCPGEGSRLSQGRFLFVPDTVPPKMFMFIGFSCPIEISGSAIVLREGLY